MSADSQRAGITMAQHYNPIKTRALLCNPFLPLRVSDCFDKRYAHVSREWIDQARRRLA